jgi:hypothetical protein
MNQSRARLRKIRTRMSPGADTGGFPLLVIGYCFSYHPAKWRAAATSLEEQNVDSQTLTLYASVATIVALFLSVVQLAIAWRERREAKQQTSKLSQISDSLSTRYIGALPDYYPHVLTLLGSAHESITILCDYPAYGCYTNMKSWLDYHDRLRNKNLEGVKMTLVCPAAQLRSENDQNRYFPGAHNNWGEWIKENLGHATEFARHASSIESGVNKLKFADAPRADKFFQIFRMVDEAMLNDCFSGDDCVKQIDAWTPIDFWIVDGKRAIFAFSNYGMGMSRHGFSTTDQALIRAFQATVDNYRC